MLAVILFEQISERFILSHEAKRRTLNFQNRCFFSHGHDNRGVARLSGKDGNLSKTGLRLNLANPAFDSLIIVNINVELTINQNVKSVSSPVTFINDLFTWTVHEQTGGRPNLLAGIVPAINNDLQVQFVLEMIFVFFN